MDNWLFSTLLARTGCVTNDAGSRIKDSLVNVDGEEELVNKDYFILLLALQTVSQKA